MFSSLRQPAGRKILKRQKGRAVGISLIAAVVMILSVLAYVKLTITKEAYTLKVYGSYRHEIYYDAGDVQEWEADKVAKALTKAGFFSSEGQASVQLEKERSKYIISIPLINDAWNDQEVVDHYKKIRTVVQTDFPYQKIEIRLCAEEDISDVKRELE